MSLDAGQLFELHEILILSDFLFVVYLVARNAVVHKANFIQTIFLLTNLVNRLGYRDRYLIVWKSYYAICYDIG